MSDVQELHVALCAHPVARRLLKHYHYTRRAPVIAHAFGVWAGGRLRGVITYGPPIGKVRGYTGTDGLVLELNRVWLSPLLPKNSESKAIAVTVRALRRAYGCTLAALISYADSRVGHVGTIYQALGWRYMGQSKPGSDLVIDGELISRRAANSTLGTSSMQVLTEMLGVPVVQQESDPKHVYVCPLTDEVKRYCEANALPYPKRPKDSSEPPAYPGRRGRGSTDPAAP